MNSLARILTIAATAALSSTALANPRNTFTFTNVLSDSTPVSLSGSVTTTYNASVITISGLLIGPDTTTSKPSEAIITVIPPDGKRYTIEPSAAAAFDHAPITHGFNQKSVSATLTLPEPVAAKGAWTIRVQDINGNAGEDARWSTLKVTIHDGGPVAADIGPVADSARTLPQTSLSGAVKWYRFTTDLIFTVELPGTNLHIDTEGSTDTPTQNVDLAVYDSNGRLVASDTSDASGNNAALSFGGPDLSRSPIGDAVWPSGQDGDLRPGVYYLAVAPAGSTFGAAEWSVQSSTAIVPTVKINLVRDYPAPRRSNDPLDFNRDGVVGSSDLVDYLNSYLAGGM